MVMEHTKIYYLHKGDHIPFYVGKSNRIEGRKSCHRKNFGPDTIIEIIDEVPLDEWKFWEGYWIEQIKCWGFILENKNQGGGGVTKQNFGPERAKKIRKATLGKPKSHKGRSLTEEHKAKIKATRGYIKDRVNTWTSTPVLQFDLDGNFVKEWASQKEATTYLGVKGDGVGACCRGRQKKAYGFIWKYKN